MRRLVGVFFCVVWGMVCSLEGAEYKLTNGEILRGEPASFNDDGLIVRLELGGFSQRIPYGKLTQETLKLLAENPAAKTFVEPYIELPAEVKERRREAKKEIVVREPTKVELVQGKPGFFAALGTPIGLFVLGLVYLGNLYAGLEVARFRARPVPLVVGVSAIAPVLGPVLFALLPPAQITYEAPPEMVSEEAAVQAPTAAGAAGGLGLAAAAHAGAAKSSSANPAYAQIYNRQNTTFDRRFFETKFTGFFRVVPADTEKYSVLVVKGARAEYVAKRISRISANEMHMQLQRGNEVSIPFGEIVEVSVRHKDAK